MNTILSELEQLKEWEARSKTKMPIPCYFYISRYGRMLQSDMEQITELLGRKGWFHFLVNSQLQGKDLLQNFTVKLEQNTSPGKEFNGCIVVEFQEQFMEMEKLDEFLEYLYMQGKRYQLFFMMKSGERQEEMQKKLERHFFIRRVEAEPYTAEEQLEILKATLQEHGFELERNEEEQMARFLADGKWKPEDNVENILQNAMRQIIYGRMIAAETTDWEITAKEVQNVLQREEQLNTGKRKIGFLAGGYEYE